MGAIWAAGLLGVASPTASEAATNLANRTSAVGMNLSRSYYFDTAVPYGNAMKSVRAWRETPAGGGNCTSNDVSYSGVSDANGYPTSMGSRECIFARLFSEVYGTAFWPIGQWVFRYDGNATFDVSGAASGYASAGAQRGTFDVGTSNGGVRLEITSIDSGDPPKNMRLYPPGGVCASNPSPPYETEPWSFCSTSRCAGGSCNDAVSCGGATPHCIDLEDAGEAGELDFHPLWLSRLREYRTLRFMDWLHTNHSQVVDFADWRTADFYTWDYNLQPGNVPLEMIAKLCNTLNAECYVNLPHQATDAHIQQFVEFFRDNVDAHIPIYLEYSNEVWNGQFAQKDWTLQTANALPTSEFDTANCLSSPSHCTDSFYGKRVFEMCAIAQAVMDAAGQGDRLVCVTARQNGDQAKLIRSLDCTRWTAAPNGNCYTGSDIDVVAVAPYFGGGQNCSTASTAAEVCAQMEVDVAGNYCATLGCSIENHLFVLDERGLDWPIITYEGGSHASDTNSPACVDAANDPCIADAYVNAMDAWKDLADVDMRRVRQYLQFNLTGRYVNFGNLFGIRGAMEGSWQKEEGLLGWKRTAGNECWWPDCELSVPEPTSRALWLGLAWLVTLGRHRHH